MAPPSALPSGAGLRDAVLRALFTRAQELSSEETLLQRENLNPELVYQAICDNTGDTDGFLETHSFCRTVAFNDNHRAIAGLATNGIVDTIVTTNFDCLVELALANRGLKIAVYREDEEFDEYPRAGAMIHVVKLHGCIKDKRSMVVTLRQTAKGLSMSRRRALQRILRKHHVIFAGYSANDVDIYPVLQSLPNSGMTWLLRPRSQNPRVESLVEASDRHAIVRGDINHMLPQVASHLSVFAPSSLPRSSVKIDLGAIAHRWALRLHPTQAIMAVGRMLETCSRHEDALRCWRLAATVGTRVGRLTAVLAAKVNEALYFSRQGRDRPKAKAILEAALTDAIAHGETLAIGIIKSNLAIIEATYGNHSRATLLLEEVDVVYQGVQSQIEEARLLCNRAALCSRQGAYCEAEELFQRARSIFLQEGELVGARICAQGLATVAQRRGNTDNALSRGSESVGHGKTIGDTAGTAEALLELGMNLARAGRYDESIARLTQAQSMFQELGDCSGLAKASLWINVALQKDYG